MNAGRHAGDAAAAPIDVSLVWGNGASDRQTVTLHSFDERYRTFWSAFTAAAASQDGRLGDQVPREGDVPCRHRLADAGEQRGGVPA
jgi:hypothetical protein